jgi:UTP--glucose-1-phosphate uridylyltransferase
MTGLLGQYHYPKDEIEPLIKKFSRGDLSERDNVIEGKLEVPSQNLFKALPDKNSDEYRRLHARGKKSIENSELGMVILNGGMATRFSGAVKGIIEVFDGRSFLELKIEDARKVSANIHFYIMNSFATSSQTAGHLEDRNYFGAKDSIEMFGQFIGPRVTDKGGYFKSEDKIQSFYGPGHGDFPYAFRLSGMLDKFIKSGGRYPSDFRVPYRAWTGTHF